MNSTPQFLASDLRAVAQGAQLGPGDLPMDAAAWAAVVTVDDVFSADDFSRSSGTRGGMTIRELATQSVLTMNVN